ncbi:unnamed protein product [Orchesella dallaii]|uniref:Gustatory receptor n=1 Tax=Orchesella dallaii TaxID=48710 RepID=A0ABP1QRE9_9HEXA
MAYKIHEPSNEYRVTPPSLQANFFRFRKNQVATTTDDRVESENLEDILKYFFAFAKLIGVRPVRNPVIRWSSFVLIPALLLSHTTVDLVGWAKKPISERYTNAFEMCIQIASAQFYGIGAIIYIVLHWRESNLTKIFEKWRKLPVDIPDVGLRKFSILVPGFIMTSAILENICFHFRMFPVFDPPPDINNLTWGAFQVYYDRHHTNWSLLVPFHPILGTLLILANKFALYAWNYADLLVVVLCRALAFRFAALYRQVEDGNVPWTILWKRYAQLMEILNLLEAFLSPSVLLCFYINLYATCMQLHSWMTPESNLYFLHTIYLLWSFVHLLVRVFLVMYHASRVQNLVEYYFTLVQNCPLQFYTKELARQIRYPNSVERHGMGISGMGCFVITKPFMLRFASVAFFFEVFLNTSERVHC